MLVMFVKCILPAAKRVEFVLQYRWKNSSITNKRVYKKFNKPFHRYIWSNFPWIDIKCNKIDQDSQSSCKSGAEMSPIFWQKPCQPEICNFGKEIVVQKNVVGFDISVYYTNMEFLVQISQPLCCPHYYIISLFPLQETSSFPYNII